MACNREREGEWKGRKSNRLEGGEEEERIKHWRGEEERLDGVSELIPDELIQGQKGNKKRDPQDETVKHTLG